MPGKRLQAKPKGDGGAAAQPATTPPAESVRAKGKAARRGLSLRELADLVPPGGPSEKY